MRPINHWFYCTGSFSSEAIRGGRGGGDWPPGGAGGGRAGRDGRGIRHQVPRGHPAREGPAVHEAEQAEEEGCCRLRARGRPAVPAEAGENAAEGRAQTCRDKEAGADHEKDRKTGNTGLQTSRGQIKG